MHIQWFYRLAILFSLMDNFSLLTMEYVQEEKEEKLLSFYKKAKESYKNEDQDIKYKTLISEVLTNGNTVQEVILSHFQHKSEKAIDAIRQQWDVADSMSFSVIKKFLGNLVTTKSTENYEVEYPQELEDKVFSKEFESLIKTYQHLSDLPYMYIKISGASDTDNFSLHKIADTDAEGIWYGNWKVRPVLTLSRDFFSDSREEQEFTLAHECAHAKTLHSVMDLIMQRYCISSQLVRLSSQTMPSMQDWLMLKEDSELYQKIEQTLNENEENLQDIKNIFRNSSAFLKFSRAKELEADCYFATFDLERAKIIRKALLFHLSEEKPSKKILKKGTHPSWKKRFEALDIVVKLLEVEQSCENSKLYGNNFQ